MCRDEVLCSDAQRTRTTFAGIAPALPATLVLELKPALYHAGPDVMMAVLQHAKADCVMMIGHNPGIAEFAHRLVSNTPMSAEFTRYPTGATLVVDFAVESWAEVGLWSGRHGRISSCRAKSRPDTARQRSAASVDPSPTAWPVSGPGSG